MLNGILKALEGAIRAKEADKQRRRNYVDIGCCLWYDVAYNSVLSYKKEKMDQQKEPFSIYQWGNKYLVFGPIKALVSEEDKKQFIKTAEAELRDKGYIGLKVSVNPDAVIVSV